MQPKDLLVHLEKGDRRLEMLRDFSEPSAGSLNRITLGAEIQNMANSSPWNQVGNFASSQLSNMGVSSWFNR